MCGLHVNFKVFLFILSHTIMVNHGFQVFKVYNPWFFYVCGFQVDVLSWFTWATLIFAWQKSPTSGSAKTLRRPDGRSAIWPPGLRSKTARGTAPATGAVGVDFTNEDRCFKAKRLSIWSILWSKVYNWERMVGLVKIGGTETSPTGLLFHWASWTSPY